MTRHSLPSRPMLMLALMLPVASLAQRSQRTNEQKIADAMSAAPMSVSSQATLMDWPASQGGTMQQLRSGSNGWVCYPTTPSTYGNAAGEDAMCLDPSFQQWASAWMNKTAPQTTKPGIAYMLRGDAGASNTDPYATAQTADNSWVTTGPHVMVLVPDPAMLNGYSTDPKSGGPWVMWAGTPYAHLMVPVPPQSK